MLSPEQSYCGDSLAQNSPFTQKNAHIIASTCCSFVFATYLGQSGSAYIGRSIGIFIVTVEIVILAMVAAFLGLRLFSVLGRRADHGDAPMPRSFDSASGAKTPVTAANAPSGKLIDRAAALSTQAVQVVVVPPAVENGMRAIMAADRRFDSQTFLEGVQSAYRMILEAYWRGDTEELAKFCDKDVADAFGEAIAARVAAGEVLENRLVRIEETSITAASFNTPVARISVCLTADIAAITRDAAGTVIAGSLNDAVQVRDVWTFRRDITSPDPDWQLDETDEG